MTDEKDPQGGKETPAEQTRPAERLTDRLRQQWDDLRAERRGVAEPIPLQVGPSNTARAQVPWGVDLAAAWAWRVIVIGVAGYAILRILGYFSVITLPIVVALLLSALAIPAVSRLRSWGIPSGLAALTVVLSGLTLLGLLLTFAGQQVAQGASDLANSAADGLVQIKIWLRTGPLNASDSQINDYIDTAQSYLREKGRDPELLAQVGEVGARLGHIFAGFFIVLFATYFFLAEGERIWAWCVRLAPRAARARFDSSGRVAWVSLTQFVRATVIVAAVDAIGIVIVAAALGVPFVLAIGTLVFLGAFIPYVGAAVAGTVAVLVALVDGGPLVAGLMLLGVIAVQQLEGHVLQPFLLGRWVAVHPLAVILAIGAGVIVAGIAGVLIAVPAVAALNAVVQHLASTPWDDAAAGTIADGGDPGAP